MKIAWMNLTPRQPAKQEEFTDLNKDIEMVTSLLQNNLLANKIELELRHRQ
jgi:hypothetical protein